ncbi:helix-turn-helix transcriptional regulator [Paenibacillus periandrae]|uniref:helix-turn-helix transcriptional regulator n=1 Tax=Paenibacillus periandrae TaxID=1761741 RepID=UPI001F09D5F9|nr:AraC family transcriptional regulator [Paenibacillus periandrae]
MHKPSNDSLRTLLSNLQIDVIIANVQTVGMDWKRENYVHSFNRLYFIIEGEGQIEVDGIVYYPKPGQLVVMPCHVLQSYSTINDHPFHKYWCHFTARVGNRDLLEMYRFPVCIDVLSSSEVESWFSRMISEMKKQTPSSILNIQASMLQLIGLFIDHGFEQTAIPSSTTQKLSRVFQFIEQNLEHKITIEQLASLVHYHPNYFIRAFHSVMGCSPIQYINRMRLDKARQMLSTDMTIGSIARAVGIEQHNFSTMFKSYTGFSPRDFRQLLMR